MEVKELKPRKALNKAFLKVKPNRIEIETFKTNLITLLDRTNDTESEEFHKNLVSDFLKDTYYKQNHFINTKGRNDLVIHNGPNANSSVGVIIEAKKPTNKNEMLSKGNINKKAFQELVLYYLRERITHKNLEVKHLIITNINEWFIFDATTFDRLFAQNKNLVKQFDDFESGRLADTKTDFFYKQIAEPFIAEITTEIEYTYFNIQEYQKPLRNADKADDNALIALFKLLSPEHLLKLPFTNDSNSLDKRFYSELLHIIGLTETKEGGKKLIQRNKPGERNSGSILEDAIIQLDSLDKLSRLDRVSQYGSTTEERLFNVGLELSITWINRILFLKLLEAQLITYNRFDKQTTGNATNPYSFLNLDKIKSYDDLNSLFFQVLARKYDERNDDVQQLFRKVPYLNSSLFEPTEMEQNTVFISNLRDDKTIPVLSSTVLKNDQGKKRTGNLTTLEYLFEFLNAYDFSSEGAEEIQEDNKSLINASVLGLIFEKINGYKDGSFFTPGFITMYMCRETIRKAVVQKFNDALNSISSNAEVSSTHSAGNSPQKPSIGKIELQGQKIDPIILQFARDNRKKATQAEDFLWQILRNRKLNGLKFRRQHPVKDKYILDFYCAEKRLVVEIDGGYHLKADQKEYDEGRTSELNELELKVIRFTNDEVLFETERVLQDILDASEISLTPQPPLSEREGEQVSSSSGKEDFGVLKNGLVASEISLTPQPPLSEREGEQVPSSSGKEDFGVMESKQVPSSFGKEDLGVMESKQVSSSFGRGDLGVRDLKKQSQLAWNLETINDIYELIPRQISRNQANKIINSLKICDPAVGSGHFLVSALNEIIAVKNDLKILEDREGKSLHRYEVEVVNDELIVTDEEGELYDYNPNNKESQRIQETLFHEKQTIIENCLFGVDINPNSVKICRLRLWIELLKNAYYKNATELETLPNIDINIKCGNSLVSRFAIDADLKQALKKSKWSIDSYRLAVDTYRNAESKEQKRAMERLIADIKSDFRSEISQNDPKLEKLRKLSGELFILTQQTQLFEMSKKEKAAWTKKVDTLTNDIKKLETEIEEIKANKIFENAFEWRFEFPEVLNDEGDFVGFDVVIGNPPYISAVNMKRDKLTKDYFTINYPLVTGTYDIYSLFVERIKFIGNKKVSYSYIIPNKFLIAKYSEGLLYELIKTKSISSSINLSKHNVFEEASVYPIIINGQVGKSNTFTRYFVESLIDFINNGKIVKEIELKVYPTLKDSNFSIQGGLAGFQAESIKQYLFETKKEDTIEFTVSGGVDRYYYDNCNIRYMGNKYSSAFIDINNGLSKNKLEFYTQPKVIIAGMTKVLESVFTEQPLGLGVGIYGIHSLDNIEDGYFLAAYINSKFVNNYFTERFKDKALAGGYLAINKNTIEEIPYIEPAQNIKEEISIISKKIHSTKHQSPSADTTALETQIDQLVYQLYELTEEEIAIVEGSTK